MTSGRDDDAFRWEGDDDPTLDSGAAQPPASAAPASSAPALPQGFTAVGKGSGGVGRIEADGSVTPPVAPRAVGNVTLVALGIVGGVYLLWAIGWLIGGLRLHGVAPMLVSPDGHAPAPWTFGNAVSIVLGTLAPFIWLGTVILFTRRSHAWLRWLLLILGVVLLLPWPFVMVGAVGA